MNPEVDKIGEVDPLGLAVDLSSAGKAEVEQAKASLVKRQAEQFVQIITRAMIRDLVIGGRQRAGRAISTKAKNEKALARRRAKNRVAKQSRKRNR